MTDKQSKITLTFTEGYNMSASLENVNPMMLWAAAEWLRSRADQLDMAQQMHQQGSVVDVVKDFPGGLKRV